MPVMIRDEHFERKVDEERARRGHKVMSKTLLELAQERLIEIQMGQFLQPAPPRADHESAALAAAGA